jgi:hypothetical protein
VPDGRASAERNARLAALSENVGWIHAYDAEDAVQTAVAPIQSDA